MKILIISAYDSLVNYSVFDKGRILEADDLEKSRKFSFIRNSYWTGLKIPEYILKQYDKIFLCEDGSIEVIK